MSLTVFVPTVGRPALWRTFLSLRQQDWQAGDEVVVLGDKEHDRIQELWDKAALPGRLVLNRGECLGCWGYGALNANDKDAAGTHCCHIRDDVIAAPDMLTIVRAAITKDPQALHLFRLYNFLGPEYLWRSKDLRCANLTGENAVYPNDPRLHGKWGMRHEGDWDFIEYAAKMFPVLWHENVTLLHEMP